MTLRDRLSAAARDYLPNPRLSDSSRGLTYEGIRASGTSKGRIGTSSPPRGELKRYRRLYDTCALVRAPINQMASDVTADGVRFTAKSDDTKEFLNGLVEDVALVGGENRHLIDLIEQISVTTDVGGEAPAELIPAQEDSAQIAAIRVIPPETLTYQTRPGQAMLLRPDDTNYDDVALTDDRKAAAVVQHRGSRFERALDLDSFIRLPRDPNPGSVRGTSAVEPIADRVDALRKKLEDSESAIASKAHGLWFAGAEPLVVSGPDGDEVREPDEDVTEGLPEAIQNAGPGDVITHDAQVGLDQFQGEVADLQDYLRHDVNTILSAFEAPRYTIGAFDDSINRRVTQEQKPSYAKAIGQRKRRIERMLSPVFKAIAEQRDYSSEGVAMRLEPEDDESPVRSLSVEQSEVMLNVARSIREVSGTRDPATLIEEGSLLDLVLQLPEDATLDGLSDLENQE